MSGTARISGVTQGLPRHGITLPASVGDKLGFDQLFVQMVAVRGDARIRLLEWAEAREFFMFLPPTCDPDSLTVLGLGSFFEPVFEAGVMCMCIASSCAASPEGDIAEIAEFLRGSAQ